MSHVVHGTVGGLHRIPKPINKHNIEEGQWLVVDDICHNTHKPALTTAMVAIFAEGAEPVASAYAMERSEAGPCTDIHTTIHNDHKPGFIQRLIFNKRQLASLFGAGGWQEVVGDEPEFVEEEDEESLPLPPSIIGSFVAGLPITVIDEAGDITVTSVLRSILISSSKPGCVALEYEGEKYNIPTELAQKYLSVASVVISTSDISKSVGNFLSTFERSRWLEVEEADGADICEFAEAAGISEKLLVRLQSEGLKSGDSKFEKYCELILIDIELALADDTAALESLAKYKNPAQAGAEWRRRREVTGPSSARRPPTNRSAPTTS